MKRPRSIVLIGFSGAQSLDLSGPFEVFSMANRFGAATLYDVRLATSDGGDVVCNSGLRLGPAIALPRRARGLDTVLIAGGSDEAVRAACGGRIPDWIVANRESIKRIGSVCSGALILASTGLLNGRRATTHWDSCDRLAREHPKITVEPDAIFVVDAPYYTSAGVTAGIDLALLLVENDHGPDLALQIARNLLLFMRRAGGQTQFSPALKIEPRASRRLGVLIAQISSDPATPLNLPEMARKSGMSQRNFSRVFKRDTGMTPLAFLEGARVDRAKSLLESTDWTLERISTLSGFGTIHGFHRAFQKNVGTTPGQYRARFGNRGATPFQIA